jgi:phosphate transport system permease protein
MEVGKRETDVAWERAEQSVHRRWLGYGLTLGAIACLGITILPLLAIMFHMLWRGLARLDWALWTQLPPAPGLSGGGVGNALLGSLLVVGLATLLAVPIGLLAGIYVAEYGDRQWLAAWVKFAVLVLNGLPSILAGVFIYGLLVGTGIVGFSAIAGGVALAVLMLPLIVQTTATAVADLDPDLRAAAAAVGASSVQQFWQILLPAARPTLITGVMLAIARAAGETAPLLFTALNSSLWFQGWTEPIATLPVLIYNFAIAPFPEQQALAWAAAFLLVTGLFVTNLLARWMAWRALGERR